MSVVREIVAYRLSRLAGLRGRQVGPLSRLWPVTALQVAMVSGRVGDPLPRLGLAACAAAFRST